MLNDSCIYEIIQILHKSELMMMVNSTQGSDLELLYWEAATGTQVNWEQVARSDMIFNRGY